MTIRGLPQAIIQFRLWEESGFDRLVIENLRRRAEEREAERTRRRLATRLPKSILRSRRAEVRAYEAAELARMLEEEREQTRLEAIASDPRYSDEDRRLARIELAGRLYRQHQEEE